MAAARELMQKGGLTLPQIADKAGFSSAAYLSASFKDYYGQSPSELMRSSANKLH
jgi:AraC-like DNA-binding protein